jgi:hypothetical protein
VTALPNTGLFTSESGTTTNFTIKFNVAAPAGGSVVTVVSNNTDRRPRQHDLRLDALAERLPGQRGRRHEPLDRRHHHGQNDSIVDGPIAYTIGVTETGFGRAIPNVNCTNNDNDTPGITVSKTSGLITTEAGGQDTFTVSLNTQPNGPITMTLLSSNTAEATVSPAGLTFSSGNWSSARRSSRSPAWTTRRSTSRSPSRSSRAPWWPTLSSDAVYASVADARRRGRQSRQRGSCRRLTGLGSQRPLRPARPGGDRLPPSCRRLSVGARRNGRGYNPAMTSLARAPPLLAPGQEKSDKDLSFEFLPPPAIASWATCTASSRRRRTTPGDLLRRLDAPARTEDRQDALDRRDAGSDRGRARAAPEVALDLRQGAGIQERRGAPARFQGKTVLATKQDDLLLLK